MSIANTDMLIEQHGIKLLIHKKNFFCTRSAFWRNLHLQKSSAYKKLLCLLFLTDNHGYGLPDCLKRHERHCNKCITIQL